jgi:DNA polymerase III epsilon subunit-like protein
MKKYISEYINLNHKICKKLKIKSYKDNINELFEENDISLTNEHLRIYNNFNRNIIPSDNLHMVLDVETNGYNTIIQICYFIVDDNNYVLRRNNFILCNKYYNKYVTDYYKKITENDVKIYGCNPIKILLKLNNDAKQCKSIIGHNIAFDIRKLKLYFEQYGLLFHCPDFTFDTMSKSKQFVLLKDKRGRLKNPKLLELCEYFNIKNKSELFHDAEYDVLCTYLCFMNLKKLLN